MKINRHAFTYFSMGLSLDCGSSYSSYIYIYIYIVLAIVFFFLVNLYFSTFYVRIPQIMTILPTV